MVNLQVMLESGAKPQEEDHNKKTYVPQYLVVVQESYDSQAGWNPAQAASKVAANVFMRKLQGNLGFSTTQVRIMEEDGYEKQDTVLYCKFTERRYWCQLKA